MCDFLKIAGMQEEIFYLKKEIDICREKLMQMNENLNTHFATEVPLINKSVMECLLDEIQSLKQVRYFLLSQLFQEEYNLIRSNANSSEKVKTILINMITHLYLPYNMHREEEIRNKFVQMM